jgi:hypothetical protein
LADPKGTGFLSEFSKTVRIALKLLKLVRGDLIGEIIGVSGQIIVCSVSSEIVFKALV